MRIVFVAMSLIAAASALSAPKFVTPRMHLRNGLTDEQYDELWKMGRNPSVTPATARDWMYRANRYTNVVEWLDICGKTNDFAKLSHKLQGDNFALEETNKIVRAENRKLVVSNETLYVEMVILAETNAVLAVDAEKAQKVERSAQKAKKKDEKNFNKWISDTEKAKSKSSSEMSEFYDAILELAQIYDQGE